MTLVLTVLFLSALIYFVKMDVEPPPEVIPNQMSNFSQPEPIKPYSFDEEQALNDRIDDMIAECPCCKGWID